MPTVSPCTRSPYIELLSQRVIPPRDSHLRADALPCLPMGVRRHRPNADHMSITQTFWLFPVDLKAVIAPDGSDVATKLPVKR